MKVEENRLKRQRTLMLWGIFKMHVTLKIFVLQLCLVFIYFLTNITPFDGKRVYFGGNINNISNVWGVPRLLRMLQLPNFTLWLAGPGKTYTSWLTWIILDALQNFIYIFFAKHMICVRGRPFDSWGGGYDFFVKKKIVQQLLENK